MSQLTALYNILSGATAITDVVSTRIYPIFPPQRAAFPLLVFTTNTPSVVDHKSGTAAVDEVEIQVDTYTKTALDGETLQAAVRSALDGYTGTTGGVNIIGIYLETTSSPQHDPDMNIFWFSSNYTMRVRN